MKTTLIIPDCHHPYVDDKAWALLLKVARAVKPTSLVIMGDFGDFVSVTSHAKSAKQRMISLSDELFACNQALSELDELEIEKKFFIMGNHEDRIDRYINERCPEMHGLMGTNIYEALRLKDRSYQYVSYRDHVYHDGIWYTHDTGTAGINAHRSSLHRYQNHVVIGHTHRMGFEAKRTLHGKPIMGFMPGWLGDASKCAGYAHTSATSCDWTLGFGIARLHDGVSTIEPVVISDSYTCVAGGKFYT